MFKQMQTRTNHLLCEPSLSMSVRIPHALNKYTAFLLYLYPISAEVHRVNQYIFKDQPISSYAS